MMTESEARLHAHMDILLRMAGETIAAGQQVTPMWVLHYHPDTEMVIVTPWGDQEEKRMAREMIRCAAAASDAYAISFVTEAWAAQQSEDPEVAQLRASQRSDRREVVMIHLLQPGNVTSLYVEIIRDEHGSRLAEPERMINTSEQNAMFLGKMFDWSDITPAQKEAASTLLKVSEMKGSS